MTQDLTAFYDLRDLYNGVQPLRNFSFGVCSFALSEGDNKYCQDMVKSGKLSYYYHHPGKANIDDCFYTIYYEKGIPEARPRVYSFRLPFFGLKFSVNHGTEFTISGMKIKIDGVDKKTAEEIAKKKVTDSYNNYCYFIQRWILKEMAIKADCFPVLQHYYENDGILSIPEFVNESFLNHCLELNLDKNFISTIKCLNKDIKHEECPHCGHHNITSEKVIKCSGCGRNFMI